MPPFSVHSSTPLGLASCTYAIFFSLAGRSLRVFSDFTTHHHHSQGYLILAVLSPHAGIHARGNLHHAFPSFRVPFSDRFVFLVTASDSFFLFGPFALLPHGWTLLDGAPGHVFFFPLFSQCPLAALSLSLPGHWSPRSTFLFSLRLPLTMVCFSVR